VQTITVQDTTRPAIVCPVNVTINCEASTLPSNTGTATATDNCTNTVTNISSADVRTNGSCNDNYVLARTWTAVDSCNNSNSCVQMITVQDTTRPAIVCPVNVTINCEASTLPANTGTATATDNCTNTVTNLSSADVRTNGSCNDNYVLARTWTAVDSCNNSNSCVQTITVQDTTRPAIVCPVNVTINCEASTLPSNTGTATATDNCTNTVTNISSADVRTNGSCNDNYVLARIWTAVDSCNNSNSCVQTITVQDTTRPAIVCPVNVIVTCYTDTSILSTNIPVFNDNCTDEILNLVWTNAVYNQECIAKFDIDRVFTIYDSCGNINSCTQRIQVRDTIKPLAKCIDRQFVYLNTNYVLLTADSINNSSIDNCTLIPFLSINRDTIFCNRGLYTQDVILTVTDSCGNSDSCISVITLIDVTPPEIQCPSSSLTVQLNSCQCFANLLIPAYLPNGITAIDNCDTSVQVYQILPLGISLDSIPPGTHEFGFVAIDDFNNADTCYFTVIVLGANAAELSCKAHINLSLDGNCEANISALTMLSGAACEEESYRVKLYDSNSILLASNTLGYSHIGNIITAEISYLCAGNSCSGTVLVEDKLPPKLICTKDTIDCGDSSNLKLTEVLENCGIAKIELLDKRWASISCDPNFIGLEIKSYQAFDNYGNYSDICFDTSYVRRVNLGDIYLDSLFVHYKCNGNYKKDVDGNPLPNLLNGLQYRGKPLDAGLECNIYVKYTDVEISQDLCKKKIFRVWKVYQWWCNQEIVRTFNQYITIIDDEAPVILTSNLQIESSEFSNAQCLVKIKIPVIEAMDQCSGINRYEMLIDDVPVSYLVGNSIDIKYGIHEFKFIAFDHCNNTDTLSIIQNFFDRLAPQMICDQSTVVSLNNKSSTSIQAMIFDQGSYDNCGIQRFEVKRLDVNSCSNLEWDSVANFCCEDVGKSWMVALRAVDYSGNSASCMVSIEIQDKNKPRIVAPPDIRVDCRFSFDFAKLGYSFGKVVTNQSDRDTIAIDSRFWHHINGHPLDGIAYDNCNLNIIETIDTSGLNECGMGVIIRKFVVVDGNRNRDSAYQHIYIDNHSPMTYLSIIWPEDYETNNICDQNLLRPELLQSPYNRPGFVDDECSQIGIDYKDYIFTSTSDPKSCYKIFREWIVTDWCYRENGVIVIFKDTQIIKVNNTIKPIITQACRDTTICSYDVACKPIPVTLSIAAIDNCTNGIELLYRFKIDFHSDGTIDVNQSFIGNPVATGTWPLGRHTIKWEVEDRCGNTATCQSQLNLLNCKPPSAYAHRDLAIGLTGMDTDGDGQPDTKLAIVWASDLDAGSNHNCGYPLVFSFSKDTSDTRRVYTCDSIGSRQVELWVTDPQGNTSFVKTLIIVNDNPNQIPICKPKLLAKIEGSIYNPQKEKIERVEVVLENSGKPNQISNYNGDYAFENVFQNQSYVIKPYFNDDWLNGVSTADIVSIQKHILGKEVFASPYQMIAADVNNSKSITSADISELRKLILGIKNEVSSNTSWRFISSEYIFGSIDNCLKESFDGFYKIDNLDRNMIIDFVGVKIGDLNNTAKTRGSQGIQVRTNTVLHLNYNNQLLAKDKEYEIDIYSDELIEFQGFQTTFKFNSDLCEVISVAGNPDLNLGNDNINSNHLKDGLFSVCWNSTSQKNNSTVLKVKIRSKSGVLVSELLSLSSTITESLSIDANGNEAQIDLIPFKSEKIDFEVFQNNPNPWQNSTSIGIIVPSSVLLEFRIYNIAGKLIYESKRIVDKGYSELKVDGSTLPCNGLYYYQIQNGELVRTNKMMYYKD
ncbi:MAG: T9SS type A sorting domain-containing protein, partial [Saprospiraceae bacterium]|nr:T9SS type A sorting domain-containing protein [Saprospiraceae bacterium]